MRPADQGYALVTGGAGFIGSNLADRLVREGRRVVVLDNLARPDGARNVAWLVARHGDRVRFARGDVRHRDAVRAAVAGADQVFHLAAHASATASLADPWADFEVNAAGTLHVLEAVRARPVPPPVVLASTSRVYGDLADVELRVRGRRYEPVDAALAACGVDERRPLEPATPHGCGKAAADHYVRDFARTQGLPACVLRVGSVYGPRQLGTEDQGWLAHVLVRARRGQPIALHGDGRQVRDALYVDDLVDALLVARDAMDRLQGRAFNVGGGPSRTTSLRELVDRIAVLRGRPPALLEDAWRVGNPRWYVSDPRAFEAATGWRAHVDLDDGLRRLDGWLAASEIVPLAVPRRRPALEVAR